MPEANTADQPLPPNPLLTGKSDTGGEKPSEDGEDKSLSAAAPLVVADRSATGVASLAAAPGEAVLADRTQIERMAAAIAEVAARGAEARYVVEFPRGLLATSAVIARDATGALLLRIVGLEARVTAQAAERLRADLTAALSRRRLRIARIDLTGPGTRLAPVATTRG